MGFDWQCPECGEFVSPDFDRCWNCGTSASGERDPSFQHADDYLPPLPQPKRQFGLRHVFQIVTGICVLFSLFNVVRHAEADSGSSPIWLLVNIALLGVVLLFVLAWISTVLVRRIQRQLRKHNSPL
jgi:hypothetical protein